MNCGAPSALNQEGSEGKRLMGEERE